MPTYLTTFKDKLTDKDLNANNVNLKQIVSTCNGIM